MAKHLKKKRILFAILMLLIAFTLIGMRIHAARALNDRTQDQAITTVNVIKAPGGPASEEIVLPGNVRPWHEAPIYARTNGYLKQWYTGMGTHVKTGQLMAEIDTPEIDAQLHQAIADLATAKANNDLAQITATRWEALLKTDSVSKQETDEKIGDAKAKAAALASAQANVDRLKDLESFKRVVAPFDGVVTARLTDIGALINSGSTTGQVLFQLSQHNKLRVYVSVPENYAYAITPDMEADITFTEHSDHSYKATLYHTAEGIDNTTRTELIEFLVENNKYEILPGGFADVHMKLAAHDTNIRLPVNALLFRKEGLQVATIDANNKVLLKSVKMGRDFGNSVEILSGIEPQEIVIVNPPDSLSNGQAVRVAEAADKHDDKDMKK